MIACSNNFHYLQLDFTLLTFGTLGMLIKWVRIVLFPSLNQSLTSAPQIDTSNITNAFVSGMKEDLNLYGNQYNYIIVAWTVGYIVGQWVSKRCLLLFNQIPMLILRQYSRQTSS